MSSIVKIPINGGKEVFKKNYLNETFTQIQKLKCLLNIIKKNKNNLNICRNIIIHFHNLPLDFLKPKSIYSDIFNIQLINLYLHNILINKDLKGFIDILNLQEPLIEACTNNINLIKDNDIKIAGKINIEYCNDDIGIYDNKIKNVVNSLYDKLCKITVSAEKNIDIIKEKHDDIIIKANNIYNQSHY